MADLSYNVRVNTADAQRSLNGLKSAFGGLLAAVSVGAIVRFGDGITNLQNKLRTISRDTADVERQFAAIAEIANSSRSSLNAVGDLYFKIASAADALGVSQRDAAVITDTVSKGLILSGSSAQGAAAAVYQLGQAFSTGLLRGEELNSLFENGSKLASILADELGVTVGGLRKLASEGKLTGDVVSQAFIRANASINEQFGRTLPTISQSFTKLQTTLGVIFADLEANTAVFAKLADAVINLATSLATFAAFVDRNGEAIMALVKILGTLLIAYLAVFKGVRLVQTVQSALIVAFGRGTKSVTLMAGVMFGAKRAADNFAKALGIMAANPAKLTKLGYAIAGIGAAMRSLLRFAGIVGLFLALGQAVNFVIKSFTGFDVIDTALSKIKDFFRWMRLTSDAVEQLPPPINAAIDALDRDAVSTANNAAKKKELAGEVRNLRSELIRAAQAYGNQANELERSLSIQNSLIGASQLKANIDAAQRQAESAYFAEAQRLQDALAKAKREGSEAEKAQIPLLLEQLAKLDRRYADNLETIKRLVTEQESLVRARELEVFATEAQTRTTDELSRLQREQARVGMSNIERKYLEIADAADESARAAIRAEEARRGEKLDPEEVKAYYAAATRGADDLARAQARLTAAGRTFSAGWTRAFKDYADAARDNAALAGRLFTKFTSGMEDAIVNFTKTGRLNFRQMVADMSEELLRSQIRKTITGLAENFGLGDLMGGPPGSSQSNPIFAQIVGGGGVGGALAGAMGGGGGQPSLLSRAGSAISGLFGGGKPADGAKQPSILQRAGSAISGLFGGGASARTPGINPSANKSGGGILSSLAKGAKSLFSGFFANGGVIPAGKFGMVGERGPELISGPAGITPLTGMGGSTNVTYNISAVDAASFQALVARDPGFIHAVAMQGGRGIPSRR